MTRRLDIDDVRLVDEADVFARLLEGQKHPLVVEQIADERAALDPKSALA